MSDPRSYPPYPQQQYVYQQVVKAPSNGSGIAALVLGIVAIAMGVWIPVPFLGLFMMFLAFVPAVLAVIFGHVGLAVARRFHGTGRGQALAGLILGYVTLSISVATTCVWLVYATTPGSFGP